MNTVSIRVDIRIHDDGRLGAAHAPLTDADADALSTMRFGGQDVVAAALMGEAVRRQAHLLIGLISASDPARMMLLKTGDVRETSTVAAQVLRILTEVAEHTTPSAVVGAVRDVTGTESPPAG